jgi:hypothetical protein
MICKIGTKSTTLAALTRKLATVIPPSIFPFRINFTLSLFPQMTLEISASRAEAFSPKCRLSELSERRIPVHQERLARMRVGEGRSAQTEGRA